MNTKKIFYLNGKRNSFLMMKNPQDNKGILFLLLKNSIVQFAAGTLSVFIILKLANSIPYKYIELLFKAFGYGFFYYLTTPFMIYWLAYASQGILTTNKLMITVSLMAFYSYILWDSYFFFKDAIDFLLLKTTCLDCI
jgi:hypothetical protein